MAFTEFSCKKTWKFRVIMCFGFWYWIINLCIFDFFLFHYNIIFRLQMLSTHQYFAQKKNNFFLNNTCKKMYGYKNSLHNKKLHFNWIFYGMIFIYLFYFFNEIFDYDWTKSASKNLSNQISEMHDGIILRH